MSTRHPSGGEPDHGLDFWQLVLKGQRQLSGDGLQSPRLDSSFEGLMEELDPVHLSLLWGGPGKTWTS